MNKSQKFNFKKTTLNSDLLEEAVSNLEKGSFDKAKILLNKAINNNFKVCHAYHLLGVIEIQLNNFSLAIEKVKKAIEVEPNVPEFHSTFGVALQKKGLINEAIESYREAIKINPNFAEAYCNKGNAFKELGDVKNSLESYDNAIIINPYLIKAYFEKALILNENKMYEKAILEYKKIIKIKPNSSDIYYNIGNIYDELGIYELAINYYDTAIQINPRYLVAIINRGNIYKRTGDILEALKNYDAVIEIESKNINALNNKAAVLGGMKRYDEAISIYKKIISIDANFPEAYYNRAINYKEMNEIKLALNDLETAIKLKPNYSEAWCNKGAILNLIKDYSNAIINLDMAININPNLAEAWSNRGHSLLQLENYNEAIKNFNAAIELKDNYSDAWSNKGFALGCLKLYKDALTCHKKAIELEPKLAQSHLNISDTYLSMANFKDGWKEYEWRWDTKKFEGQKPNFSKPVWNGEKTQQTVFIWAEQGLGDQILYSSVFTELSHYLPNVIVGLDKRLIPIYQRSFPNLKFVDRNEKLSEDEFDFQIPIGSTVQFFRSNLNDFEKSTFPYLAYETAKNLEIINKFKNSGKLICGISWRSANPDIGDYKSIPLNAFDTLLSSEKLQFINLQYKSDLVKESVITKYRSNIYDVNEVDIYNDIDSLASIIQACDIVITCSNTTAHLAGALNKKTLLILPVAAGRFWYWSDVAGKSIWYPSVKVFHQKVARNWEDPINEIEEFMKNST